MELLVIGTFFVVTAILIASLLVNSLSSWLISQGKNIEALAVSKLRLKFEPMDTGASHNAVASLMNLNRLDEAQELADSGLRACEKFRLSLGGTYQANGKLRRFSDSVEDCNVVLSMESEVSYQLLAYVNRAAAHFDMHRYQLSLRDSEEVINRRADGAPTVQALAYVNRAGVFLRQCKFEESLRDSDVAIQLDPRCYGAYRNRSMCKWALGDFDGSQSDLDEALRLAPERLAPLLDQVRFFVRKGQMKDAVKCCEEAIQLDKTDPFPYIQRADLYLMSGRTQLALLDSRAALNIDGSSPEAFALQAIAKTYLGDLCGALRDSDEALSIFVAPVSCFSRAVVKLYSRQLDEALDSANKGLSLHEWHEDLLGVRALVLGLMHRYSEAILDVDKARQRFPLSLLSLLAGAVVLAGESKLEQAMQEFDRILSIERDYAPAYFYRATVLRNAGQQQAAQQDFERATLLQFTPYEILE